MPDIFPSIPCPPPVPGRSWVYILQSADGSLYIGQTVNFPERLRKHRFGLGSKHTHDHEEPRLVYRDGPITPDQAVARERQLKRWSRAKKEALVCGDLDGLRALSRSRERSSKAMNTLIAGALRSDRSDNRPWPALVEKQARIISCALNPV